MTPNIRKYRPSNGTEGESFIGRWCARCTKDANQDCEILGATMMFDVDDDEYPAEWQYGRNGHPKCTAFESKAKPRAKAGPKPVQGSLEIGGAP